MLGRFYSFWCNFVLFLGARTAFFWGGEGNPTYLPPKKTNPPEIVGFSEG